MQSPTLRGMGLWTEVGPWRGRRDRKLLATRVVTDSFVTRAAVPSQILGMADDLTLTLGLQGFNALKLVPYGELQQVLPWLLRRLDENQASQ